jgi:hypothetical protein
MRRDISSQLIQSPQLSHSNFSPHNFPQNKLAAHPRALEPLLDTGISNVEFSNRRSLIFFNGAL